jgi:hypothetical protein
MAGDWIKMRTNLDTDPAVVRIASGLKTDRYSVVGRLHRIWSWANEHLTDGQDVPIDSEFLDALVETPGFSEQLRRVGWLSGRDGSLSFPSFERHNGASAKARALDSERKRTVRKMSGSQPDKTRTREEKSIRAPTLNKKEVEPDVWEIPDRLNTGEVRELLDEFEDMRRATKKPIKNKRRASKILDQFDDVDHLIYALTTCIGNEYQGLKPEYKKPTNGKLGKQPVNLDEFVIK